MIMLPMMSSSMMTVVNPSTARPDNFITSVCMISTIENKKNTMPHTVTTCIGKDEYDAIEFSANLTSARPDHLDRLPRRSSTSKHTLSVLKPVQPDIARKNVWLSGMSCSTATTFASSSLKSDALFISIPVAAVSIL